MNKQRLMELAGINEARLANRKKVIVVIGVAPGHESSTVIGPFPNMNAAKKFVNLVSSRDSVVADDYDFEIATPESPDDFLAYAMDDEVEDYYGE